MQSKSELWLSNEFKFFVANILEETTFFICKNKKTKTVGYYIIS